MAKVGRPAGAAAPVPDAGAKAADHDLAPRLSFPLTRDKKRIAYRKLQDKTKDQLREVLADPDLAAELGVTPLTAGAPGAAPATAGPDRFPPELCGVIFDALSMITVAIAGKHLAPELAAQLAMTADDKAKLNGPTAAMIDKYAPNGLNKYEIEVTFALAVGQVIAGKLAIVRGQAAAAPPAAAPDARSSIHAFPQRAEDSPAVNT